MTSHRLITNAIENLKKIHAAGIGHYGSVCGDDEFKLSVDAAMNMHESLLALVEAVGDADEYLKKMGFCTIPDAYAAVIAKAKEIEDE